MKLRAKVLVGFVVVLSFSAVDRYASKRGIEAGEILVVRPGMSMDEVMVILGDPARQEVQGNYKFFCRCNPEEVCSGSKRTTWTYTRKPLARFLPFVDYPMLWVHFNSRGRVDEVYAKKYFAFGLDDRGVYMAKLDPCDTTDRTVDRNVRFDDEVAARQQLQEMF